MRRPPSRRELIGELVACVESEGGDEELERLLVDHLSVLAEALTTSPDNMLAACRLAEDVRRTRIRELIKIARERGNAAHALAMQNLAVAAAGMLGRLAQWTEASVELDPRIVIGGLLSDRARRLVRFDVEGYAAVVVARSRLRDASRALPFPDLRCFVDGDGLHFRWRGGKGGLVFVSQDERSVRPDEMLSVVIAQPRPEPIELPLRPDRLRRSPAWIGELIADLGFL